MLTFLAPAAVAGYADAVDGLPTWADRDTFQWSNAVRADPAAFEDDYPCAFSSFTASEQTTKALLRFNADLAAAAAYHSQDMSDNDYFDHDEPGGRTWSERVWSYYDGGAIAENISYNYPTPYSAVVEGWMCSAGHRSNLMSATYDELGTGVVDLYYTQDFGDGSPPARSMYMGVHRPESPVGEVELVVDWDADPGPDEIYVVLDGDQHGLLRVLGTATRGQYGTTLSVGPGCHEYYFVATAGGDTETWPEDGSYGWGDCAYDDEAAGWFARQAGAPPPLDSGDTGTTSGDPPGDDDDDDDVDPPDSEVDTGDSGDSGDTDAKVIPCGCRTGQPPGGWVLLVLTAWALGSRSRSRTSR